MARGVSTKLTATLPAQYSRQWLERIDKRTKVWRALSSRIRLLEEESGGSDNLTHAKRSLVRRAAFLELLCESQEMRFVANEPTDVGAYTQAFNRMQSAYKTLGCVDRRVQAIRGPAELVGRFAP